MMTPNPNYQSYLLRFWRDNPAQPWRSSLQCTATAEKFIFADLRTLLAFLTERLAVDPNADELAQMVTHLPRSTVDG